MFEASAWWDEACKGLRLRLGLGLGILVHGLSREQLHKLIDSPIPTGYFKLRTNNDR